MSKLEGLLQHERQQRREEAETAAKVSVEEATSLQSALVQAQRSAEQERGHWEKDKADIKSGKYLCPRVARLLAAWLAWCQCCSSKLLIYARAPDLCESDARVHLTHDGACSSCGEHSQRAGTCFRTRHIKTSQSLENTLFVERQWCSCHHDLLVDAVSRNFFGLVDSVYQCCWRWRQERDGGTKRTHGSMPAKQSPRSTSTKTLGERGGSVWAWLQTA